MVKNQKGKSYTAAAKAKVNYPKLKSKTKSKPAPTKKIPSPGTIKVEIEEVRDNTAESSGDSISELVTEGKTLSESWARVSLARGTAAIGVPCLKAEKAATEAPL